MASAVDMPFSLLGLRTDGLPVSSPEVAATSFPLKVGVACSLRPPPDNTIRDKATWSMEANDAATAGGSAREISGMGEGDQQS